MSIRIPFPTHTPVCLVLGAADRKGDISTPVSWPVHPLRVIAQKDNCPAAAAGMSISSYEELLYENLGCNTMRRLRKESTEQVCHEQHLLHKAYTPP